MLGQDFEKKYFLLLKVVTFKYQTVATRITMGQ